MVAGGPQPVRDARRRPVQRRRAAEGRPPFDDDVLDRGRGGPGAGREGRTRLRQGRRGDRIAAARDDGTVSIVVADNGPGLPPTARENLFSAFRGAARPGGTGLGLAIAADLVRAHGGSIRLNDAVDAAWPGATFEITLPARDGAAAGETDSANPAGANGKF